MDADQFYFFILKRPKTTTHNSADKLPCIKKIRKDFWIKNAYLSNTEEAEGPFDSLYDLKRQSLILKSVALQKHRQRILKVGNIKEIVDVILINKGDSYELGHIAAFEHVAFGKIANSKVKGVHFYNPNFVRITEMIYCDPITNWYLAKIEKFNSHTKEWIEKESLSGFFPDHWDINRLFHEFNYAFTNKQLVSDGKYHSFTSDGIKVEFIMGGNNKIITCYPIMNTPHG